MTVLLICGAAIVLIIGLLFCVALLTVWKTTVEDEEKFNRDHNERIK